VLVQQLSGYLDVAVSMRRWLKNRCGLTSLEATRGARYENPGGGRSKKSKSPRLTARGSAPDRRRSFSQGPGQSRHAGAAIATKGNRSERDLRHSVNTQAAYRAALRLASLPKEAMDLFTKLKITAVMAAVLMAVVGPRLKEAGLRRSP
jgi:hypothetical protein